MISQQIRCFHSYLPLVWVVVVNSINGGSANALAIDSIPVSDFDISPSSDKDEISSPAIEDWEEEADVSFSSTTETLQYPQLEDLPSPLHNQIVVKQFEFVGSTIFSYEQLAAVTSSFTQRPLSLTEIPQISAAVTQLYLDKGYVNSQAYIPNWEVKEDGSITIEILESSLEEIKVAGTEQLNSNYIRDRVTIATQKPLNFPRVLETLQKLEQDPLINQISAEFSPGSQVDTNILKVEVKEAKYSQPQLPPELFEEVDQSISNESVNIPYFETENSSEEIEVETINFASKTNLQSSKSDSISQLDTSSLQVLTPVYTPTLTESESSLNIYTSAELLEPSITTNIETEKVSIDEPEKILIEKFEFFGNTVFSEQQLAAVTESFTQNSLSWIDLSQVQEAITQFYLDEGYINSQAYILPQQIEDGVVRVEIMEDSLVEININGTEKLNSNKLRDRLAITSNKPLHLPSFLEQLQQLEQDPLIESISAELSSSDYSGISVLDIEVTESALLDSQTPLKEQFIDFDLAQASPVNTPPPQDIVPPKIPEVEEPFLLPSPEELLQPFPDTPPTSEEPPTTLPGTITVEKFEFIGSTIFSDEQLAEVTSPFTQRPLSFAELLQARSAVTKLYVDNGYITSGAYIPTQELEGSVVKIEIVEGSLEEINVIGQGRLKSKYIRDRLTLATLQPLNVPRLLEALQLLQLNPLIETISAELSAGPRPGTSLLDVEFKTAQSFALDLSLDNGRSPSVGTFRRRVGLREANLLGFGDGLRANYTNTEGSDNFDFAYTFPFNARNGTLHLAYSTTSSDVIEPPFDDLDGDGNDADIESESRSYVVTFRQPLTRSPNQEFALGLSFDHQQSETSLLDIPFPLSPGADDQGRTRISTLRFFQEWTQRNEKQVIAARSEFSLGIDLFNATMNSSSPDSSFVSWRGQAQWVKLLAEDTVLLARSNLQLADRTLVPLEQFGLGGLGSIRGYRQDVLLTDNGFLASLELRIPILRARKQQGILHVIPFIDFGTAWNNSGGPDSETSTLASVGLGLQWQMSDRLTARFDWGIPLVNIDSTDRTLQEEGFYFSLVYRPF